MIGAGRLYRALATALAEHPVFPGGFVPQIVHKLMMLLLTTDEMLPLLKQLQAMDTDDAPALFELLCVVPSSAEHLPSGVNLVGLNSLNRCHSDLPLLHCCLLYRLGQVSLVVPIPNLNLRALSHCRYSLPLQASHPAPASLAPCPNYMKGYGLTTGDARSIS